MHQGLIFLFLLFAKGYCGETYCDLSPNHVLCVGPYIGDACGDEFIELVPDAGQQQAIVDWHNKMRQKVALGQESRGANGMGQPPAANMMEMMWDPELAKTAQAGVNLCLFDHTASADMRVLGGRFAVGQSIADQGLLDQSKSNFDFPKTMQMWYEEVTMVDPAIVDSYVDGDWGHYTQVVWWNTRSVGCGGASFRDSNSELQFFIFCNYGAAANLPGAKIYATGKACSQCPDETKCSSTNPGLCSITRSPFDVKDKFPTDQVYLGLPPGMSIDI